MRHLPLLCALTLTTSFAAAQNCFDGDFGTLLATDPQDVVLPIQPIGFPFPVGGTTYTDLHITDHGFVQLSNGGTPVPAGIPAIYTPTTSNFVTGAPKVAAMYADVIGLGGGRIYYKSSATQSTITWVNMQNFGFSTPRFDFQLTLFPNGDVRVVYGPNVYNNSTFTGTAGAITGITPGGGVTLPAPTDLSAGGTTVDPTIFEEWPTANTFDLANTTLLFVAANPGYAVVNLGAPTNCGDASTYGTGCDGMSMTNVGEPTFGNANFALRIDGVPATSPIALAAFGDQVVNPGLDLTFLGMPGCFGYTNLSLGLFTSGPVASGSSTFALAIPNNPALLGTTLAAQGVAFSAATPAGLAASNGVEIEIGNGF